MATPAVVFGHMLAFSKLSVFPLFPINYLKSLYDSLPEFPVWMVKQFTLTWRWRRCILHVCHIRLGCILHAWTHISHFIVFHKPRPFNVTCMQCKNHWLRRDQVRVVRQIPKEQVTALKHNKVQLANGQTYLLLKNRIYLKTAFIH